MVHIFFAYFQYKTGDFSDCNDPIPLARIYCIEYKKIDEEFEAQVMIPMEDATFTEITASTISLSAATRLSSATKIINEAAEALGPNAVTAEAAAVSAAEGTPAAELEAAWAMLQPLLTLLTIHTVVLISHPDDGKSGSGKLHL